MKQVFLYLSIFCLFCLELDSKPKEQKMFLADPFIMEYDGTFYAYGTSSDDGIQVFKSKDLRRWTGPCGKAMDGYALYEDVTEKKKWFWAPEVYRFGDRFLMTYSSDEHIGVAFSDSPEGPFIPDDDMELYFPDQLSIDSHIFTDGDGQKYLYWVRFGLGYGNEIRVIRLEPDCKTTVGEQVRCITAQKDSWEEDEKGVWVTEGPFVLRHENKYYLTYSANGYTCQNYGVGQAVSDSPLGPWRRYDGNPVMQRHQGYLGTGHHSFFTTSSGRKFVVFHAHYSEESVSPRQTLIARYHFKKSKGESVVKIHKRVIEPVIVVNNR